MEAVIFSLLVAALVMRQTTADIPYAIRGKTPPAHQRRMAAMANREAAAQRRHERSIRRHASRDRRAKARQRRRNTPARKYIRGVWDHAWDQAATRRVIRWQEKDPAKAEKYRERIRARQRGEKPTGRLRDWFLTRLHRARSFATAGADDASGAQSAAAGSTGAATTDTGPGAGSGPDADPADEDIVDAEVVDETTEDPATTAGRAPNSDLDATDNTTDPGHGPASAQTDDGRGDTVREPKEAQQNTRQNPAEHRNSERETATMSTSGEITGLSDAMALTQTWQQETQTAVQSLEAAIASMQSAEVGAQVTGAYQQAMESLSAAHQAFNQAYDGLQQSVNVGEAYQAAPQAGNRQFVTS